MELTQIRDLDVLTESALETLDDSETRAGDGAIVHMDRDDNTRLLVLVTFVEHGLVDFALCKAESIEDTDELLIPAMPSLFQAVQGLEESQNTTGFIFTIARRVAHVEDFIRLKFPIEVCTLNVHLM